MDEKEYLESIRRKAGRAGILMGVWLVVAFPLIALGYGGFVTMLLVLLSLPVLLIASGIRETASKKHLNIWFSTEDLSAPMMDFLKVIYPFMILLSTEFLVIMYHFIGWDFFRDESFIMFLLGMGMLATALPVIATTQKWRAKRMGKSRSIKVEIKQKDALELVKRALSNLGIEYEEKKKSAWSAPPLNYLETSSGMRITIWPDGNRSGIEIYRIAEDERKEREIEKEISKLIEEHRGKL